VEKSNVLEVSQLWKEVVIRVGLEEFPDVDLTHMYVDNCAMQIIRCPTQVFTPKTQNPKPRNQNPEP
jgi:3-isopropylmalate dehydrogenase